MKPEVQLERTGCGIASVTVLVGVSYQQAQRVADVSVSLLVIQGYGPRHTHPQAAQRVWNETDKYRSAHGKHCLIVRC